MEEVEKEVALIKRTIFKDSTRVIVSIGIMLVVIWAVIFARYICICNQQPVTKNAVYVVTSIPIAHDCFYPYADGGIWTDDYDIAMDKTLYLKSYRNPIVLGGYMTIPLNLTFSADDYILRK